MVAIPHALLPSALDRLPLSVRRVAKAACALDCSLDDVNEMVDIINSTAKTNLGQFLPVFFALLHPSRIPTPEDLDVDILSSRDVHRIHAAQQALGTIYRVKIPSAAQSPLWSRAFVWMQFFLMFEEYLPSVAQFCGRNICVDFIMFSKTLTKVSAGLMVTNPGFFVVLAHTWKLLLGFEDSELQALGLQCIFAFSQNVDNPVQYREEMVEGAGDTLDDLAALVVDTICLVAPSRENPMSRQNHDLLSNVLNFVVTFDALSPTPSGKLPPLCATMASQRLVESLTIALCALIQTTTPDPTFAFGTTLLILASIFLSPGGYRKIPDAARNGFFHAIIQGGERRVPYQHFKVILGQIFAPSTVYYTVLSGISEAFSEVEGLASSEPFRHSTIFEEWSAFSKVVSDRLKIMQRFDARNGVSQRACDNSKCSKIAVKTEFRRCSGCKAFRYCSKSCQTVDWQEGMHRLTCAPCYRGCYKQRDAQLTSRERAFLRFMLHHDYLEAKGKIFLDQIPLVLNNTDFISFTLFDYMHGQVKVETFPNSAARKRVPIDDVLWNHHVLRTIDSNKRMDLHVMLLRDGEDVQFWVVPLRTNSPFIRDNLVRLRSVFLQEGKAALIQTYENLKVPHGVVEIH